MNTKHMAGAIYNDVITAMFDEVIENDTNPFNVDLVYIEQSILV